jgi:hypothetical protein
MDGIEAFLYDAGIQWDEPFLDDAGILSDTSVHKFSQFIEVCLTLCDASFHRVW